MFFGAPGIYWNHVAPQILFIYVQVLVDTDTDADTQKGLELANGRKKCSILHFRFKLYDEDKIEIFAKTVIFLSNPV